MIFFFVPIILLTNIGNLLKEVSCNVLLKNSGTKFVHNCEKEAHGFLSLGKVQSSKLGKSIFLFLFSSLLALKKCFPRLKNCKSTYSLISHLYCISAIRKQATVCHTSAYNPIPEVPCHIHTKPKLNTGAILSLDTPNQSVYRAYHYRYWCKIHYRYAEP